MRKGLLLLALLLALLSFSASAQAVTYVNLTLTDDTYTRWDAATTNYGTSATLYGQYGNASGGHWDCIDYFKFSNIGGVVPPGRSIVNATLWVYKEGEYTPNGNGQYQLWHDYNQTWNENTTTYATFSADETNPAKFNTTVLDNRTVATGTSGFLPWDATAAVASEYNAGHYNTTLMLKGTPFFWTVYNPEHDFTSKEGTAGRRAFLTVGYSDTSAYPQIYILTPGNASYTNSSNVTFTFNVTDADTNPIAVKAWVDGTLYYDAGSYTSGSVDRFDAVVSDGHHNMTVWANDGSVTNATSLFFTTDLTAPTVAVQLPTGSNVLTYANGRALALNFTASDATGTSSCWYQFTNASNNTLASCLNSTIYAPDVGALSVTVFANDTYGHTANATASFTVDFMNEFRVQSAITPGTYYNFTGYLSNSTYTVANNTIGSPPVMYVLTSALPYGANISFNATGAGFNNTLVNIGTLDTASFLNYTESSYPATLEIFYVYDEYTLSPICYDVYVSNLTSAYNASSCGILDIDYNYLPSGVVTVSISNSSYITRNYYVTVNPTAYNALTGWLLPNSLGSYITTWVYSDAAPTGQEGVITSAERFLNGTWVTIEQKQTDSQGKGYFFLYSWAQHRIRAEYGTLQALVSSYYPNPTYILNIKLNGTYAPGSFTWLFDSVSVNVTPSAGFVSNVTRFKYLVSSPDGDLSKWFMDIRAIKGTNETVLYSNSVIGSPSGGEIWVDVNITSFMLPNKTADRFKVTVGFDRVGYSEWNGTLIYIPYNAESGYLPDFMALFTTGGAGISDPTAIYLIITFVALFAGGFVARIDNFGQGGTIGGAFVYIGVLALFAVYGLYDWALLLLMTLAAIGISLARSYL